MVMCVCDLPPVYSDQQQDHYSQDDPQSTEQNISVPAIIWGKRLQIICFAAKPLYYVLVSVCVYWYFTDTYSMQKNRQSMSWLKKKKLHWTW